MRMSTLDFFEFIAILALVEEKFTITGSRDEELTIRIVPEAYDVIIVLL